MTYGTEILSDFLWAEMQPLWEGHYAQFPHESDIKLAPDRAMYQRISDTNGLRIYTVRVDGRLVGYMSVFIAKALHYDHTDASCDVLYVLPEHRGITGLGLIMHAEDSLRREGVAILRIHAPTDQDFGPGLSKVLGYRDAFHTYSLRLDQE